MTTVITDLDNTLYDWVTFFAEAFDAMLTDLTALTNLPRARLIDEFKVVHQRHGSSEKPFAALELPSIRRHFGSDDPVILASRLAGPFETFERVRQRTLTLYPGVPEALGLLRAAGVVVIAHTEAPAINAYHRLRLLGISTYIDHLYVRDANVAHMDPQRRAMMDEGADTIRIRPAARSEARATPSPRYMSRRGGISR